MSKYWSAFVRELTPYVPGEQPPAGSVIKLNTNENPYGPSPAVLEAIRGATSDDLRLYPDPESSALRAAFAEFHGIEADQVFVGNGSDEVLAHVFHALLNHTAPVLFPDITYSFYPVYCALYGIAFETIALDDTFGIVAGDYAKPNGGIIFPNPNAPTGRALPLAAIEALLQATRDAVVVIDEAYIAFGAESAVPLIDKYDNLLVIQTLSKSHGLAGLRVGAAFGDVALIDGLLRVKNSFNSYPLDRLAIAGAVAAVKDRDHYEQTRARVIASRERLAAALAQRGFDVLPSAANFLFVRHRSHDAAELGAALRLRSIIVRHFSHPRTSDYLRITIGTEAELDSLLTALDAILA